MKERIMMTVEEGRIVVVSHTTNAAGEEAVSSATVIGIDDRGILIEKWIPESWYRDNGTEVMVQVPVLVL